MWAPVLLYELGANLGLIVFAVLLAVMFFQKRRSVPLMFIGVVGTSIVVLAVDLALAGTIPAAAREVSAKDWGELGRATFALAIWGSYFLVSQRVKATFVNARRQPAGAVAAVAQAMRQG
jgi:hypothetical protein